MHWNEKERAKKKGEESKRFSDFSRQRPADDLIMHNAKKGELKKNQNKA
jgi:hypothetical protein